MRGLGPLCLALFGAVYAEQDILAGLASGGYVSNVTRPTYNITRHPSYPNYQLRIVEPTICDPSVQQYSGYLDIDEDKHLFFWFFEARHDPENAPLMLWTNGGPGSSSISAGLLFEHGPCRVPAESNTTTRNAFSWNEKVNIIYIDQPVGTGFSYGRATTLTLADLAADIDAFLQLWLRAFPQHAARALHLAGESWAGHYVPHIAHRVHTENARGAPGRVRVPLASVTIANGLTDPALQLASNADYLCGGAPYPPFRPDDPRCARWRAETPLCVGLVHRCYAAPSNATCGAATAYCWPLLESDPLVATKKNPYDLRKECPKEYEESLCYPEVAAGAAFLNATATKLALGVDPALDFKVTNDAVNIAFYVNGQAVLNSAALLPPLVNSGVRLLVYAGDTDGVCNYMGIERWMSQLEHDFHAEFDRAPTLPWKTQAGEHVGNVRSAGTGAGNVTFVRMFEAGHMAPYDQPEASLDMITRWVDNSPFFSG